MAARKEAQMEPRRFVGDPFALMREMTTDLDRVFGDFTWPSMQWPAIRAIRAHDAWYPQVDVFEKDNRLVTKIDLPGLKKEDVKVEVTDGHLTISGERKREAEEKGDEFYRCEREYGSFFRSVPLPEAAKIDDVKATFAEGVLEVSVPMPVRTESAPRKVAIEDGPAKTTKTAA